MNKRILSIKKKKSLKTKSLKSKLKPKKSLKPKKPLKKKAVKKAQNPKKATTLTLRPTRNTPSYYHCLLNQAKSGFKGRITKACKECKQKAPALNLAYKKEAQKLVGAYQQLGISLSKILSH